MRGIGFAIPGNTAKWVVSQLLTHGRVRRGFLGIAGHQRPLHRRLIRYHELESESAVEVVAVEPQGPAARAGLRTGDLITAVNDRAVASIDDLHRFLSEWPIGRPVELSILRGKFRKQLNVVPTEADS